MVKSVNTKNLQYKNYQQNPNLYKIKFVIEIDEIILRTAKPDCYNETMNGKKYPRSLWSTINTLYHYNETANNMDMKEKKEN